MLISNPSEPGVTISIRIALILKGTPTDPSYTLCYNAKDDVMNRKYNMADDRILDIKIATSAEICHIG